MNFELSAKVLEDLEIALGPRARGRKGDTVGTAKASRAVGGLIRGMGAAPLAANFSLFGQGSHGDKSRRAIAALQRTVNGSPEVMVKVTGRQHGVAHVLANFCYISREGWGEDKEVEIITDTGEVIRTHEEKARLAERWHAWETADDARRKGSTSISMVLSMPTGTDAPRVLAAARAFAGEEMQNRAWVMALHTDTESPHVHLTIARRDHDGQRFHPGREDLFRYRLAFAEKLRDQGIDANATPRKARGITKKPGKTAIVQIERRGQTSRYVKRLRSEALANLRLNLAGRGPFDARISEQQRAVMNGYRSAALELAGAADSSSRALAGQIVDYMRTMPVIETKAAENVRVLGEATRHPARVDRQPGRGSGGSSERER